MKNIYLIAGPSGVGKTTIVEELSKRYGYKVVESYTTRPKRTPDETGHHFVSDEEFDALGPLCAYTEYNGYRYGVPSSMIDECDLYVIDPSGVAYMKKHYHGKKNVKVLGLTMDKGTLAKRMAGRGDSDAAIAKRLEHDAEAFRLLPVICDQLTYNISFIGTVLRIKAFIDHYEKLGNTTPHYVTYKVEGTVTVEIPAKDYEEAKKAANQAIEEMDFGALENIEWNVIQTEEAGVNAHEEAVFLLDNKFYFHIQTSDTGYDYTLYNRSMELQDGGQLDDPALSIAAARDAILFELHNMLPETVQQFPLAEFEYLLTKADAT